MFLRQTLAYMKHIVAHQTQQSPSETRQSKADRTKHFIGLEKNVQGVPTTKAGFAIRIVAL